MDKCNRSNMLGTVVLLLSFALLVFGQMRDDGKIEWQFDATDGSNVTMFCNDTDAEFQPEDGDVLTWHSVVEQNDMRIKTEIEESKKYKFTHENGFNRLYLTVMDIGEKDYGLYVCTVTNETGHFVVGYQKGINVNGPLILTLSDKYRYHIITAVVATSVLLGILLLGCFVYRFRYRSDINDKNYVVNGYYSSEHPAKTSNGFDNPAIIEDDSRFTNADIELTEKGTEIEEVKTHM